MRQPSGQTRLTLYEVADGQAELGGSRGIARTHRDSPSTPSGLCFHWSLDCHSQRISLGKAVVSRIYLIEFIKTQNQLKPFGGCIRLCITCHVLNFQADWPKGADLAKKYVSKDLFFAGLLILYQPNSPRNGNSGAMYLRSNALSPTT